MKHSFSALLAFLFLCIYQFLPAQNWFPFPEGRTAHYQDSTGGIYSFTFDRISETKTEETLYLNYDVPFPVGNDSSCTWGKVAERENFYAKHPMKGRYYFFGFHFPADEPIVYHKDSGFCKWGIYQPIKIFHQAPVGTVWRLKTNRIPDFPEVTILFEVQQVYVGRAGNLDDSLKVISYREEENRFSGQLILSQNNGFIKWGNLELIGYQQAGQRWGYRPLSGSTYYPIPQPGDVSIWKERSVYKEFPPRPGEGYITFIDSVTDVNINEEAGELTYVFDRLYLYNSLKKLETGKKSDAVYYKEIRRFFSAPSGNTGKVRDVFTSLQFYFSDEYGTSEPVPAARVGMNGAGCFIDDACEINTLACPIIQINYHPRIGLTSQHNEAMTTEYDLKLLGGRRGTYKFGTQIPFDPTSRVNLQSQMPALALVAENGTLTVKHLSPAGVSEMNFSVCDLSGKELITFTGTETVINVEKLPKGLYLLKGYNSEGTQTGIWKWINR